MASDSLMVAIEADIKGYAADLQRAERLTEGFAGKFASKFSKSLFGVGLGTFGIIDAIKTVSQSIDRLAQGEKSPLDKWFGAKALEDTREFAKSLDSIGFKLSDIKKAAADLVVAGAAETFNLIDLIPGVAASRDASRLAARQRTFENAPSDGGFKERYQTLEKVQDIQANIQNQIDAINLTEAQIVEKKLRQLMLGKEQTEVEGAVKDAVQKIAELENARFKQAQQEKRDRGIRKAQDEIYDLEAKNQKLREQLGLEDALFNKLERIREMEAKPEQKERLAALERENAELEKIKDETEEIARIVREDLLTAWQELWSGQTTDLELMDIADAATDAAVAIERLEAQRERLQQDQQFLGKSPQLALKGSQQEAAIVNAARNQGDPRMQALVEQSQRQIQTLERQIQILRDQLTELRQLGTI